MIAVRPARREDAATLAALSGELGYPASAGDVSARLEALAARGAHAVLVAEEDGGPPLGFVHVFGAYTVESDPFAEIGGLVVAARARGRGVGAALVAAGEDWARGAGFPTLRVRSRLERAAAHAWYERRGYARVKTQAVFTKELAPPPAPSPPPAPPPASPPLPAPGR